VQIANEAKKAEGAFDAAPLLAGIETTLKPEDIVDMAKHEEFILTVTENGFGKRSSAYEYRITNRGGSGIVNIITSERNGAVVASFPVNATDDIMLMTDKGKLIRCPVRDIRIAGRSTQGVTIFRTAADEKVVTTARIAEDENNNSETADGDETITESQGETE
jgi:DNA gyrase subunit A